MNIIFAGTPEFAASSLTALLGAGYPICAVYTQPDRPAGRGRKLLPSDVKKVAVSHQIPVFQPENFKTPEAVDELAALKPDLMIVAAYGLILPKAVLEIPRLGCINIHASLLPRWRGAAPIQRAIETGDKKTGITIMQMDVGLDTGAMLLKKAIDISAEDTGGSLHDKLAALGGEAIVEAMPGILDKTLPGEAQNDEEATYAHKLTKEEGKINWQQPSDQILRKIRALNPWPVAFAEQENTRIRIFEATSSKAMHGDATKHAPGTVLQRDKKGVEIACIDGTILITSLQLPGSKRVSAQDFANGNHSLLTPDSILD